MRSLDELIALLPYQLGFVPRDALVVAALRGKELIFTGRISLRSDDAAAVGAGLLLNDDQCRGGAAQLVDTATRQGADRLMLFAFEEHRRDGDALAAATVAAARRAGLRVSDQVAIHAGRRYLPWSADVRDRVDGAPVVEVPASPAITARTLLGRAPLHDRAAVTAQVAEDSGLSRGIAKAWSQLPGAASALPRQTTTGPGGRVSRCPALWARILSDHEHRRQSPSERVSSLTDREVAALLRSLQDVHWRDALIAWSAPGSLPLEALRPAVRRAVRKHFGGPPVDQAAVLHALMALARRAPDAIPEATAPISAVVGCVAWQLGEGAIARDAHERALRVDPSHRLARLGLRVVALGIRQEGPWRSDASTPGGSDVPRPGQGLGIAGERAV